MTRRVAVYAALLLPILVVVAGVALDRIIEAMAVAVVLFAIWAWARRQLLAREDPAPVRGSDPWGEAS